MVISLSCFCHVNMFWRFRASGIKELVLWVITFADNAINFTISIYRVALRLDYDWFRPWRESNVQRICGQLYQFAPIVRCSGCDGAVLRRIPHPHPQPRPRPVSEPKGPRGVRSRHVDSPELSTAVPASCCSGCCF